jgi:hypothetical protein
VPREVAHAAERVYRASIISKSQNFLKSQNLSFFCIDLLTNSVNVEIGYTDLFFRPLSSKMCWKRKANGMFGSPTKLNRLNLAARDPNN